ncbi:putative secreted effector protein [Blumeria graminis f. sp. tritici 96224]|nr:putative secreted effector protein [Blumeria graminis f. sp. tritici 96224]
MWISVYLSTAKLRHLLAILFTATTLLNVSLQSDVSGYICGDLAVWHDEAIEVARLASKLLTPMNPRYVFPALLEDTKLFGIEKKNLFLVPFRNFRLIRHGMRYGPDRIVIDEYGNFEGVVFDLNNRASVVPAYEKCKTFLTFDDLRPNLDMENNYKALGHVCGSNFLGGEIETELKSKCSGLENLSPNSEDYFQLLDQNCITRLNKHLRYKHIGKRNYNVGHTNSSPVYHVEFTFKCILIRIKPAVRAAPPKPACLEVWTPKPSLDISINPLLNPQNQNQESGQMYHCNQVTFTMIAIKNYLKHFYSLQEKSPTSIEDALIYQNEDLMLWLILSPERNAKGK